VLVFQIIYQPTEFSEATSVVSNAACSDLGRRSNWEGMHLRSQTKINPANEQEWLEVLNGRADKLGYQIEPSMKMLGYCLWRSWPGVGREMILGRSGDVALDAIAQKLDEIEAEAGPRNGEPGTGS
jgi:hypothetical protein